MLHDRIPLIGSGAAGAAQLLTSAADIHLFSIPFKCKVIRVQFSTTTAVSSSVSAVVEFDRIPKSAGTREAAFAQLTIPTGVGIGKMYYEEPSTQKILYPGDQVAVQVATAASSTGAGHPSIIIEEIPERPANEAAMVSG